MNAITNQPQPGAARDHTLPSPELNPAHGFTPAPQPEAAGIAPGNPRTMPGASSTTSNWGTRYDGWTPDRQRTFLEAVSEGRTVTQACRIVGLSTQSAYAFRRRAQGAAFSLGWQAASLLVRDEFADALMDRARHGVTDTITYRNGETVERHRHDNRLGATLLARLDRLADRAAGAVDHAAARLVATEFEAFLDCLGRGPARAGTFLGARAQEAGEADLAPIRALARADRWLRTHTALADEVDVSDLDPAQRAGWSGAEWARAEAAGLVALAPPPQNTPSEGQVRQPSAEDEGPVWWDEQAEQWRTRFPPPPGFIDHEEGDYGEDGYERALSPEEEEAIEAPRRAEIAERARIAAAERDELFGFAPEPVPEDTPAPHARSSEPPLSAGLAAALSATIDALEAMPGAEGEDADWEEEDFEGEDFEEEDWDEDDAPDAEGPSSDRSPSILPLAEEDGARPPSVTPDPFRGPPGGKRCARASCPTDAAAGPRNRSGVTG